jgi:acyl dehydratase
VITDSDAVQLGQGYYFEDFPVGRKFRSNGRTIQDADVCAFVNVTHMNEVLFTDMEYVRNESAIKGRLVPAALTYCFAEGLVMADSIQRTGLAFLNMELDVKSPAFAGDTIHVEMEVIEARLTRSRLDRGLVRTRNEVKREDGMLLLTYSPLRLVKAHGKG